MLERSTIKTHFVLKKLSFFCSLILASFPLNLLVYPDAGFRRKGSTRNEMLPFGEAVEGKLQAQAHGPFAKQG